MSKLTKQKRKTAKRKARQLLAFNRFLPKLDPARRKQLENIGFDRMPDAIKQQMVEELG